MLVASDTSAGLGAASGSPEATTAPASSMPSEAARRRDNAERNGNDTAGEDIRAPHSRAPPRLQSRRRGTPDVKGRAAERCS